MGSSGRILLAAVGAIAVPGGLIAVLGALERLLCKRPRRTQRRIRPWLWAAPALVLIGAVMVYPLVDTIRLSLLDASGESFKGFANYVWAVTDDSMVSVLRNNLLWLVLLPLTTLALGVATAVLTDRVRYERLAKAAILLPTAISFVVAAATWRQVYGYAPAGLPQTGVLNALMTATGADPVAWLLDARTNNYALIFVAVWMSLGLATIILSAAVKAVPGELLDAARIDGAGEWHVFRHVILPGILPAVAVVGTTLIILAGKVFDVVYVMTNGNYGTDVIGTRFYSELSANQNYGRASAIAVLLFLIAIPIAIMNLRRMRQEDAG